jgi:hypothetical protein
MTCDENRDVMLDVLYGEELDSKTCFQFFQHLDACPDCSGEYRELLTTREQLQGWEVEEPTVEPSVQRVGRITGKGRFNPFAGGWWLALQRLAAGVLIVLGAVSILQNNGYLGGQRKIVSEQQMTEMVHDMIVADQAEERRLVGQTLLLLKEDVELQRRQDMREVYNYLVSLEERYASNLEENNRYLRNLASK